MNKAFFFDRDGIINEDYGFVHRIENFDFRPGLFHLMRVAQSYGYMLIICTNQSGIARGLFTEADYRKVTEYMLSELKRESINISKVYHNPYHRCAHKKYQEYELDRKPNPGMMLKAKQEFDIDMSKSVSLGDKSSDALAAKNAGIEHRYYLKTNYELDDNATLVLGFDDMVDILTELNRDQSYMVI
jgi:D-glycero-D-manno-heptose 1,7-bisphosphate phosphatase